MTLHYFDAIRGNVTSAFKNQNHQYIHMKCCYRAYVTPTIIIIIFFLTCPVQQ